MSDNKSNVKRFVGLAANGLVCCTSDNPEHLCAACRVKVNAPAPRAASKRKAFRRLTESERKDIMNTLRKTEDEVPLPKSLSDHFRSGAARTRVDTGDGVPRPRPLSAALAEKNTNSMLGNALRDADPTFQGIVEVKGNSVVYSTSDRAKVKRAFKNMPTGGVAIAESFEVIETPTPAAASSVIASPRRLSERLAK